MSTTRGPSGLSMNTVELKHQWAMQRNRTLVQTYLLSSSVLPLPGSRSRDDFRLPSLSRSTHGRTTTVPLNISEPCLFTPGQSAVIEGFSKNRHPLLHKRGPSSPSCKTLDNTKTPQQSYHQVYMHFSQPLKPVTKLGQGFTHSLRRAENRGLQPLVRQRRQPVNLETLSVRGKTCLPSQHLPTSSSSASRTQLHVFLPAEGTGQEEDRDSESVDEGFMDELDNKVTTLKRQQDPKTPKQREKSLTGQTSKGNKGSDVSLHCFPTDEKRRKVWEDACGRIHLPKDPRLCSLHFSPDAFEAFSRRQLMKELAGADGYKRRLKLNAVPSIFPHKESKLPRISSEILAEKHRGKQRRETQYACACHDAPATEGDSSSLFAEEPDDSSVSLQSRTSHAIQSHVGIESDLENHKSVDVESSFETLRSHFTSKGVNSGPSQSTEAVSPLGSTSAAHVPMASEDSTELLLGDAAGSEVEPDAVESCLLSAAEADVDESNLQISLVESQQMEQDEVEEMEEDPNVGQQSGVDHESGPEKASETDQNDEENSAQEHSEQKQEERKIAVNAAHCSEELVIAKIEGSTNEMAIVEDHDGTMEVDGSDDAGKSVSAPIKREKTEPSVVPAQSLSKTEVKPQVAQLSAALPVKVKDEPMDEEYENALEPLGSVGNIKDEPDTAAEFNQASDAIKISAVFSVGGNASSIAQAAISAKSAPASTLSLRSLAPANPIGVVCTGCNKVLLKGQTAFQRKGCPKLYCSPQCLCSTSNVVVKIPQKKQCHHCHKDIDSKDAVHAPVDMAGTVKEFCSQKCLNTLSFKCSVCQKTGMMTHCTCEEPHETALDSEEEFTYSSEEEQESDDEWSHFEERLDPAEDVLSDGNEENDCDQMPVAKKPRTSKHSAQTWKTETEVDLVPQNLRFVPARDPGPQLWSTDSYTPLTLFKLFFSESAVSTLCYNTNAQAARSIARGRKYKWTDVSVSEMYRYFGLIFYMGMVKLSSINDYWRQGSLFSVPFPATIMSRDRYRTISWNMHMSHPAAGKENDKKKGTEEYDRLFRVKPLMDTIRLACKTIYHPRRNLAVDERMVACKANTGMTQYMKSKPTKWGFKLFVLADSSNGYTVDFSLYTGKNNVATGNGLPYDTVMSLLDRKFLGSGYHVYMDNFYTSPKLLTDLLDMKFGACGTYRDHRKNIPQNAANSLTKNSPRGSIRWIRNGPLVFVKWLDTREVSVCSTIHPAYTGDTVQRRVKTQETWSLKAFPCPAPVVAYNQYMGGVDLSDQLLQYYTTQHKTLKWYRKIFLHFLDIAATNSYTIHKELYGNMTHKEFMEQLIAELCGVSPKVPQKRASSEHVPVPGAPLSTVARKVASSGRRICVHCKAVHGKKQQTPWKCQACDVHLCLQLTRNCFQDWHKAL